MLFCLTRRGYAPLSYQILRHLASADCSRHYPLIFPLKPPIKKIWQQASWFLDSCAPSWSTSSSQERRPSSRSLGYRYPRSQCLSLRQLSKFARVASSFRLQATFLFGIGQAQVVSIELIIITLTANLSRSVLVPPLCFLLM